MQLLYQSPLTQTVRRLKFLSLATCASAVGSTPFLWMLGDYGVSPSARAAAVAVVLGTGVGSTALLSYFLKPYVLKMELVEQQKGNLSSLNANQLQQCQVRLTTLDLFNRPKQWYMRIGDLKKPEHVSRPLTNLITNDGHGFYFHEDQFDDSSSSPSDSEKSRLWQVMQRDASIDS